MGRSFKAIEVLFFLLKKTHSKPQLQNPFQENSSSFKEHQKQHYLPSHIHAYDPKGICLSLVALVLALYSHQMHHLPQNHYLIISTQLKINKNPSKRNWESLFVQLSSKRVINFGKLQN